MPAALEAGRVDAIWVVEPFLSAAVGAGGRDIASYCADTAPDLTWAWPGWSASRSCWR